MPGAPDPCPLPECAGGSEGSEVAGDVVVDPPGEGHRRVVRAPFERHQPRGRRAVEVEAAAVRPRPFLTEGRDRYGDEPGMLHGKLLGREAEAGKFAVAVVVDEYVCLLE